MEPQPDSTESMPMPYGLLLNLLFLGLGVHYVFVADASARSKMVIGGLLVASVLPVPFLPAFVWLVIQFGVSGYILSIYRLQDRTLY
jgi:hypothetical protein